MEEFDDIVRIYPKEGYETDIVNLVADQHNRGIFHNVRLFCQDGTMNINGLMVGLLFPWLHQTPNFPERCEHFLLPDYTLQAIDILLQALLRPKSSGNTVKQETGQTTHRGCQLSTYRNRGYQLPADENQPLGVKQEDLDRADLRDDSHGHESEEDEFQSRRKKVKEAPEVSGGKRRGEGGDLGAEKETERKIVKRSAVWRYYTPVTGEEQATCIQCGANLSTKLGSTKGLISHLRAFHSSLHAEFLSLKTKKPGSSLPLTVQQTKVPLPVLAPVQTAVQPSKRIKRPNCCACEKPITEGSVSCPQTSCTARYHGLCAPDAGECGQCERGGHQHPSLRETSGSKKYRLCTECGKSVQNLAKHLKIHKGIKPDRLQCHICEKTLCSSNALKVHIESVHEGIRRFRCKFCENSFIYSSHLKHHILVVHHNFKNPKAFCSDCGKQFKFISAMKRHRRIVHLGEIVPKKHFCPQCKHLFYKESQLNTHLRDAHGMIPPKRKPPRSKDSIVDKNAILAEYPELVKPEDLEFTARAEDAGLVSSNGGSSIRDALSSSRSPILQPLHKL